MTLDEAFDAVDAGKDAAIVAHQTEAAETLQGQILSAVGPKVSANVGYTVNQYEAALDMSKVLPPALVPEGSEPIVVQAKDYVSGSFTVSQPLFSGSALPAYQGAVATGRAADAQQEATLDRLHVDVARMYWGVLTARERTAVATHSLEHAREALRLAEVRQKLGNASPTDVLRAKLAVSGAERDVADAEAAQAVAEQNFARILAVEPGVPLEHPSPRDLPFSTLDAALASLDDAPALLAADERARAADKSHTAQVMTWTPTVSARFTEMYSQNTGFSGKEWNWQAGLSADWTWDGGYRISKSHEAGELAHASRLQADRDREQAHADVKGLWERREAAIRARELAGEQVALADENLRVSESSYSLGSIDFLTLDDARRAKDGADLGLLAAEMELDLVSLELMARTGDL